MAISRRPSRGAAAAATRGYFVAPESLGAAAAATRTFRETRASRRRYGADRSAPGRDLVASLLDLKGVFGRRLGETNEDAARKRADVARAELRTKASRPSGDGV